MLCVPQLKPRWAQLQLAEAAAEVVPLQQWQWRQQPQQQAQQWWRGQQAWSQQMSQTFVKVLLM